MSKHKVLIPLDGSEFSRQILPQIHRFLSSADNELILLRVVSPLRGITGTPTGPAMSELPMPLYSSERDIEFAKHPIYASQLEDSLAARLEQELQTEVLRLQEAGYTVSTTVRFGNPAEKILDLVETEDVDLVAMTTHGRTGLSHLIFGSVAERVLHRVSVPVMLLRPLKQPASLPAQDEVFGERVG